jgi:hypothetical protein
LRITINLGDGTTENPWVTAFHTAIAIGFEMQ